MAKDYFCQTASDTMAESPEEEEEENTHSDEKKGIPTATGQSPSHSSLTTRKTR